MLHEDITVPFIAVLPLVAAVIALLFAAYLYVQVRAASRGGDDDTMQKEISETIQKGAMAFLTTEYTWLLAFVGPMCIFFFVIEAIQSDDGPGSVGWKVVICFIMGAFLSASAGWVGMLVATDCNVKTAEAAKTGLDAALRIAFAGGGVMGFVVVGLGLGGLSILFILFSAGFEDESLSDRATSITDAFVVLAGFSFGASGIALFARVAGGIYTKAADVGADLVGKVECDFPEDSYYNPATIADNVGDNVGDVAGMGADLFESYVGSMVAAGTLAMTSHCTTSSMGIETCGPDLRRVALPFWISAAGIIASILGFFAVRTNAEMSEDAVARERLQHDLLAALHRGVYVSSFLALGFSAIVVYILFERDNDNNFDSVTGWKDYACMIIGLFAGIIIGEATEYFTSYSYDPTRSITKAGVTGPATVIIQGLGMGMLSSVPPVIVIAVAVMSCSALSGVYGAAIAAVGMLSTLGVTLATDAYGPVADNAGGVAEMAHLDKTVRQTTDALDALGNTTAATGKGFAVGSAVLTALAFMNAFSDKVKLEVIGDLMPDGCSLTAGGMPGTKFAGMNYLQCEHVVKAMAFGDFFSLTNPLVLSGVLIGAMLPFLFAALTMLSVGKAATGIILEVRRQLNGPNGAKLRELATDSTTEGWVCPEADKNVKPEVEECVAICTKASLAEMLLPGGLAILTPIGIGLLVGARCLGGLLMGSIGTGFLLAVMMNNAGGAWDNSKKWIENEHPDLGQGKVEKGSDHHSAVVTGDTVGDPFKDTSGPALNILIKLMSVLSLTCAGIFRNDWDTWIAGVIVLIVEAIFCGVCFYFVWYKDDTGAQILQNTESAATDSTGADKPAQPQSPPAAATDSTGATDDTAAKVLQNTESAATDSTGVDKPAQPQSQPDATTDSSGAEVIELVVVSEEAAALAAKKKATE